MFITDRGRTAHVLLSIEDYRRLTGDAANIVDLLGYPDGVEDVPLEAPASRDRIRSADFA